MGQPEPVFPLFWEDDFSAHSDSHFCLMGLAKFHRMCAIQIQSNKVSVHRASTRPYSRGRIGALFFAQKHELNAQIIAILVDLFNREIIGLSAGVHKTAALLKQAFATVNGNLSKIQISHTDRGNEFKNRLLEETLETFKITRSLSYKGYPYDNAVAEAAFKIIKTEFMWNEKFHTFPELQLKLWDYVNWYNNRRIHSSLNYLTPVQYRENTLKKVV